MGHPMIHLFLFVWRVFHPKKDASHDVWNASLLVLCIAY